MRLINTTTLKLEEYNDLQLPSEGYAILSHRWYAQNEEVTFRDIQQCPLSQSVMRRRGYAKLKKFCDLARSRGYQHAWMDTCCIDKDSATELGTALNTMYQWYANSKLCIAYLEDVRNRGEPFEKSVWFRRGWTLQELIAPKKMEFYDYNWRYIGSKARLVDILSRTTGIERTVLRHEQQPSEFSVAQRMSWAAGRLTERIEDRAYSLLGLFNVSMPMVYGQREQAFILLQEAIAAKSADQSIFAWSLDKVNHPKKYSGLFAPSPDSFAECGGVCQGMERTGFQSTNIGLAITLRTVPYAMEAYLAILDVHCTSRRGEQLAILVARLPDETQWARIMDREGRSVLVLSSRRSSGQPRAVERVLHIRQTPLQVPSYFKYVYGFRLRRMDHLDRGERPRVVSRAPMVPENIVCLSDGEIGTAGMIHCETHSEQWDLAHWMNIPWLKVGFDDEFRPALMVAKQHSVAISEGASSDFFQVWKDPLAAHRAKKRLFEEWWWVSPRVQEGQKIPRYKDQWAQGYYILKPKLPPGRNESKTYSDLKALNILIRLSLLPIAKSDERHGPLANMFVWTLDIIKDRESPSLAALCISQALASRRWMMQWNSAGFLLLAGVFARERARKRDLDQARALIEAQKKARERARELEDARPLARLCPWLYRQPEGSSTAPR